MKNTVVLNDNMLEQVSGGMIPYIEDVSSPRCPDRTGEND